MSDAASMYFGGGPRRGSAAGRWRCATLAAVMALSHVSTAVADERNRCFDLAKGEQPVCTEDASGSCGYDFSTRRFALVIGNQDYAGQSKLDTPIEDAKRMARILAETYKFQVRCVLNVNRAGIDEQVELAKTAVQGIAKHTAGDPNKARFVLYFTGHGFSDPPWDPDAQYIVPIGADTDKWSPAAKKVEDIVRDLKAAGNNAVHPITIVDACRNPLTSVPKSKPAAIATSVAFNAPPPPPPRNGEARVYAAARGQKASDDRKRFMVYFAPELEERGRTFSDICKAAKVEFDAAHDFDPRRGLQCNTDWSTTTSDTWEPNDTCWASFSMAWSAIHYFPPPANTSLRAWLRVNSSPGARSPSGGACQYWRSATENSTCQKAVVKAFGELFQKCDTNGQQIATLRLPSARTTALNARRFELEIAADAITTTASASPQGAAAKLTPTGLNVSVKTVSETGLRRKLTDSKPHTPFEGDQSLTLDCKPPLRCDEDWVGVRYHPKADSDEVWRGYVPRAAVTAQAPMLSKSFAYKPERFAIEAAEQTSIADVITAAGKAERPVRYHLVAFYPAAGDETARQSARQLAILRLAALDVALLKAKAYKADEATDLRTIELIESAEPETSGAIIELYTR